MGCLCGAREGRKERRRLVLPDNPRRTWVGEAEGAGVRRPVSLEMGPVWNFAVTVQVCECVHFGMHRRQSLCGVREGRHCAALEGSVLSENSVPLQILHLLQGFPGPYDAN